MTAAVNYGRNERDPGMNDSDPGMKDFDPGTKDFSPATSDRESWTGREASRLVNPGLVGPLQKINSTAILKKPAIEFAVVADVASNNQVPAR